MFIVFLLMLKSYFLHNNNDVTKISSFIVYKSVESTNSVRCLDQSPPATDLAKPSLDDKSCSWLIFSANSQLVQWVKNTAKCLQILPEYILHKEKFLDADLACVTLNGH